MGTQQMLREMHFDWDVDGEAEWRCELHYLEILGREVRRIAESKVAEPAQARMAGPASSAEVLVDRGNGPGED